ncbi:MAG: GNAT family N-acetyltransferase [Breznakia sp.]
MIIRKATTQSDFFSLMRIRSLVFMCEQHVDPSIEIDEIDALCDHYCAFDNDHMVAALRIIKHQNTWHIGRVAVLKAHRHKQYGSSLMQYVEDIAKKEGTLTLTLSSQVAALPFYASLGYISIGKAFEEANILHQNMEKHL